MYQKKPRYLVKSVIFYIPKHDFNFYKTLCLVLFVQLYKQRTN